MRPHPEGQRGVGIPPSVWGGCLGWACVVPLGSGSLAPQGPSGKLVKCSCVLRVSGVSGIGSESNVWFGGAEEAWEAALWSSLGKGTEQVWRTCSRTQADPRGRRGGGEEGKKGVDKPLRW